MAFELLKFKILTSHLKKGHYDVNDAINLSHILITQPVKRPEFIEQILSALQQGWQSGNFTGYNSIAYCLILSELSLNACKNKAEAHFVGCILCACSKISVIV